MRSGCDTTSSPGWPSTRSSPPSRSWWRRCCSRPPRRPPAPPPSSPSASLAAIALHAAILAGSGIPPLNYAVMYAGFGWMWSAMQYVHHFGTERHVTRGARNLRVWAPLDVLWLNHNWHQTHHSHPTVPWNHLPRIARDGDPRRGFLPWAYLRMWRGPRRTAEHVENRYAGQVIR